MDTHAPHTSPKVPLEATSQDALRDFWNVLDQSRTTVDEAVNAVARTIPAFATVLETIDPAVLEQQRARNRDLERAAILEQRWDDYLAELRTQGAAYARRGIAFRDWFELLHAYRMAILPGLFEAYGASPERLLQAVEAMSNFLDLAMSAIGAAYIETKEDMIRAQQHEMDGYIADLERSNKELDEFAYVASHDLRAPLRDVDNLAQWVAEDAGDSLPADSARHLVKLRERIARMDRLLDDLLQYSRAGRLLEEPEQVALADVIADVRELVTAPDGFEIEWPQARVGLQTPRVALAQVLRNLVHNAIQHHDLPRGTIRVAAEDRGDALRITVSDDGPGIPAELHDRVFRMFQTLRPRDEVEGSGMGLALVKKLVEAHGGSISIAARDGRGACFELVWPKRHEAAKSTVAGHREKRS